ncbi:hypothetical protein GCM10022226_35830 [Sphaerisporangium flaviroseum]|uniref:Uncharacterized protein n=1 Tax=Sphaerisporangium flaviroseum TaxID=509199 RepID=A0ABP7I8B3_9ACTN
MACSSGITTLACVRDGPLARGGSLLCAPEGALRGSCDSDMGGPAACSPPGLMNVFTAFAGMTVPSGIRPDRAADYAPWYPGRTQPGGQCIARPPSTWPCTWKTV